VFLKWCLEYKVPHILRIFFQIWWIVFMWDLIKIPFYKDLNVTIHHQWTNLFILHLNSWSQTHSYDMSSFDNLIQVQYKWNLDNIFKSYLGYHDLKILHNSHDYFERLSKNLFAIIWQLGPPTFFATFTSIQRLWDHFIKIFAHITCYKIKFPK
jgi:hypothetical protein